MKKLFLGVLAIAGLVACVQEDVLGTQNLQNEIGFSGYVGKQVRSDADPSMTLNDLNHFHVWAYVASSAGNVLENEKVSKSGDAWIYTNTQYWVKGHNYRFFALANADTNVEKKNLDGNKLTNDPYNEGLGEITFTNNDGTQDVLYSSYEVFTNENHSETVAFNFDHILSKVKFTFKNGFATNNINLVVTDIQMTAPATAKTDLVVKDQGYEWKDHTGETTLAFGNAAGAARIKANENGVSDKARLTIPAGADKEYTVTFKVQQYVGDVNLNDVNLNKEPVELTSTIKGVTFEAGKAYNFVATVTPESLDLKKIVFAEPTIDEWTPEVEHNVGYYVTANGNYVVTSEQGLQAIVEDINAGELPANTDIVLNSDIDLSLTRGASNWTPLGTSAKPFKGTFDGNGKTIRNLVIDGGSSSNIGFFGVTHDGEIKNLTIENAKVSGRLNVGVVAGTPYTSKYSNITVKGHVEVNGMAYVGAVGGKNAYANWNNITVKVDETSYVNANSVENGTAYRTYVGGVIGFCGEGGHTFSNIHSNIDVKGSTIDVGGIVGIAHYGNNFVNCVCTGNVEVYAAAEEADAQEIGGIAGVWHPYDNVVMNNCSFTGTLKANNNYVIDTTKFGNLVCAAYTTTGAGKLFIDGVIYSANEETKTQVEATATALQTALANGENVLLTGNVAIAKNEVGSNAYGATGINVLNGQTIDGGGHSISVNAWDTWDSAISTTGGVIKNSKVTGGMRGSFVNHNSTHSEKVVLQNVTIDGTVYTISCDQGTKQGLDAYSCVINGWTSYAATIGDVYFENCSFGAGQGYKFCRPYAPTTFVGCNFCKGYEIDARAAVVLKNCTVNGEPVTSANLATLVTGNVANATVK